MDHLLLPAVDAAAQDQRVRAVDGAVLEVADLARERRIGVAQPEGARAAAQRPGVA